jgi:two-component system, chemotaxis family, response regulator Rcp1
MSTQERLTIMILEDNPADVHLLKEALFTAEMNFTALVFEDGESAFRYIDGGHGPESSPIPDIAILDLNVPKRNGSEVLTHIRTSFRFRHIPVVIFSSSPKHVMRDQAAQADCYITKPCELNEFLRVGEQIRDCLEAVRALRISSTRSIRRKPMRDKVLQQSAHER